MVRLQLVVEIEGVDDAQQVIAAMLPANPLCAFPLGGREADPWVDLHVMEARELNEAVIHLPELEADPAMDSGAAG